MGTVAGPAPRRRRPRSSPGPVRCAPARALDAPDGPPARSRAPKAATATPGPHPTLESSCSCPRSTMPRPARPPPLRLILGQAPSAFLTASSLSLGNAVPAGDPKRPGVKAPSCCTRASASRWPPRTAPCAPWHRPPC
jgi:hypothetical protein